MICNPKNCENIVTAVIQLVKSQLNVPLFFWKIYLLFINFKGKINKNIYRSLTAHIASDAQTVTI